MIPQALDRMMTPQAKRSPILGYKKTKISTNCWIRSISRKDREMIGVEGKERGKKLNSRWYHQWSKLVDQKNEFLLTELISSQ